MGSKDVKETAVQEKQLKKKQLELERGEKREAKRRREEEELKERVELADEVLQAEMNQEEVEGENVASNEEMMEEMDVDPTYRNNWTDRQIKSKTHQQNRTPLPTVASIIACGEGS